MQQVCSSNAEYTSYFTCIYETTISAYIPHKDSVQWAMWSGALVYIFHITSICLQHCIYMSHFTSTVVNIWTHFTANIHHKSINCNIYLPYYCKICTNNKYDHQIPYICHKPRLLGMHQWGKYATIYATYKLSGINHVTRSNVHRWCRTTKMPQPDYIYWVGHLAKSVKKGIFSLSV